MVLPVSVRRKLCRHKNAQLIKWRDYGDHIRALVQCPDCKTYSTEWLEGPIADAIRVMRDDVRYKKEEEDVAKNARRNQSESK